jgi:hypothetical protein
MTVGRAESEDSAAAMLRALVATAPGREDDIAIVQLDAGGQPLGRPLDIFDLS